MSPKIFNDIRWKYWFLCCEHHPNDDALDDDTHATGRTKSIFLSIFKQLSYHSLRICGSEEEQFVLVANFSLKNGALMSNQKQFITIRH